MDRATNFTAPADRLFCAVELSKNSWLFLHHHVRLHAERRHGRSRIAYADAAGSTLARRRQVYLGGVTSGIEMALRVVADVADLEKARKIQLQSEYNRAPPFSG